MLPAYEGSRSLTAAAAAPLRRPWAASIPSDRFHKNAGRVAEWKDSQAKEWQELGKRTCAIWQTMRWPSTPHPCDGAGSAAARSSSSSGSNAVASIPRSEGGGGRRRGTQSGGSIRAAEGGDLKRNYRRVSKERVDWRCVRDTAQMSDIPVGLRRVNAHRLIALTPWLKSADRVHTALHSRGF